VAEVGEIGRVTRVAVIVLGDALTGAGGDLAVHRPPIGRGGQHQRGCPLQGGVEEVEELAGVAGMHLAGAGGAVGGGEAKIGAGQPRPAGLVLNPDGVAAQVGGFDQRGADPAHGVKDEVAGLGVGSDRLAGDGGQHLGRVGGRFGQVAAGALGGGGLLGGRPDRQRQRLRRRPLSHPPPPWSAGRRRGRLRGRRDGLARRGLGPGGSG
jgi:hypothetical protein